jgi:hypothetical protein
MYQDMLDVQIEIFRKEKNQRTFEHQVQNPDIDRQWQEQVKQLPKEMLDFLNDD